MKKIMGNQSVGQTLLSLLIAMTLIVTLTPIGPTTAHAAESPDTAQFADKGDLMQFNTNDADGTAKAAKVYFGQNGPSDAQAWWIAGSQSIGSLTLFAASQLGQTQVFQQSMNAMPYNAEWGCVYQGETPTEVFPNHYGASKLREALRDAESSFFTGAEQALMKTSTIYTNDTKNNSVYSTIGKLYPAYGDYDHGADGYITVGANSADSLNNGLRIDNTYWGNSGYFWLRTPFANHNIYALAAASGRYVISEHVVYNIAMKPAFELDLSSVAFASAAPSALSNGALAIENVTGDGAFTLRYKGVDLGSASIASDYSKVDYSNVPSGAYLVAQNSDGAWAQAVSDMGSVSASGMGIDSFENCKVWLEKTEDGQRMTYATMATETTPEPDPDPSPTPTPGPSVSIVGKWEIGALNTANVIATLYSDGSLHISGSGDVAFSTPDAPWSSQAEKIRSVTIESGVTPSSMRDWFYGCTGLVSAPTIPSGVTDMSGTFARCASLTAAPEIPNSVKDMSGTFTGCASLTTAPAIPNSVTNLSRCFSGYTALAAAPDMTNAISVTDMSGAFYGCTSLTSAPAIQDAVTDLSMAFDGCTSLVSAPDLSNTRNVTNMRRTFQDCTSLERAPVIPTSVTDMAGTFENCTLLKTAPDMSNASNVQDMTRAFMGCTSLKVAPDLSNAINVKEMTRAFHGCALLESVPSIPSSVTNMTGTFYECISLRSVPALPDSATNLFGTFFNCASLAAAPKIPGKATNLNSTFQGCTALVAPPDMSEASSVEDMDGTFYGCISLVEAPNIPDSVVNAAYAFSGCTLLKALPAIPDGVKNMQGTFADCPAITSIPDGWHFPSGCTNSKNCFLVSEGDKVTTYCSRADFNQLSRAYDWEASNRTLTARSENPGDPDGPTVSDESGQAGTDNGSNVADNAGSSAGKNEQDSRGGLPSTGDGMQRSILLLTAISIISAAVLVLSWSSKLSPYRGKHARK